MKTLSVIIISMAFLFSAQAAPSEKAALPAGALSKIAPADKPVPKSTFGVPAKPQDGHDPFFPGSDRLFGLKSTPKPTSSTVGSGIVFNGISGSKDRRLAMINGHTLAEGEEALVNTSTGRVRVLLITIKDDRVVVEIAGERRELIFQGR